VGLLHGRGTVRGIHPIYIYIGRCHCNLGVMSRQYAAKHPMTGSSLHRCAGRPTGCVAAESVRFQSCAISRAGSAMAVPAGRAR
jgi:hypothetical protein